MKHADRIRAVARDPSASGRSALFASWTRSLTRYKLDPLDSGPPRTLCDDELRQARARLEPLLSVAESTLDRLFQAVGGRGSCVLFTDRDGVPVDRRGACADDDIFRRWGLWPGAVWSEAAEGTNGIGTCLAEARPVLIHRDQHFHARNVGLSCAAAPIHDHRGRLVASLDVSSCRDDLTEDIARLIASAVADAARRIECGVSARLSESPHRAGARYGLERRRSAGGGNGRHGCGCQQHRPPGPRDYRRDAEPRPASQNHSDAPSGGAGEFGIAERGVLHRALARADGNVSAAARALA